MVYCPPPPYLNCRITSCAWSTSSGVLCWTRDDDVWSVVRMEMEHASNICRKDNEEEEAEEADGISGCVVGS
jgi:hypothetical protein